MGYLEETREVRYVMSTLDNGFCYIYIWMIDPVLFRSAVFKFVKEKETPPPNLNLFPAS